MYVFSQTQYRHSMTLPSAQSIQLRRLKTIGPLIVLVQHLSYLRGIDKIGFITLFKKEKQYYLKR